MKMFKLFNKWLENDETAQEMIDRCCANWVCPLIAPKELMLNGKQKNFLQKIANKHCAKMMGKCGSECVEAFFNLELEEPVFEEYKPPVIDQLEGQLNLVEMVRETQK